MGYRGFRNRLYETEEVEMDENGEFLNRKLDFGQQTPNWDNELNTSV